MDSHNPKSSPATPKLSNKLEDLSRDDLIKFVKRQTFLLNRAKARIEELSQEKNDIESNVKKTEEGLNERINELQIQNESLKEKLADVEESRAASLALPFTDQVIGGGQSIDPGVQRRVTDLVLGLANESSKLINAYERKLDAAGSDAGRSSEALDANLVLIQRADVVSSQQQTEVVGISIEDLQPIPTTNPQVSTQTEPADLSPNRFQIGYSDQSEAACQTEPADLPDASCQTEPADLPNASCQTEPADLPDATCQTEPENLLDASCQTEQADLPNASSQTESADLPNAFCQTEPADLPNASCQTEPSDLPDATSQTEPADLPDASCQTEPADLPDAFCQTDPADLPVASCQTEQANLPNASCQTESADLPNASCQTEPADLPDATSQTEPADLPDASCQTEPADLPDAFCQTDPADLPVASCQTEQADLPNASCQTASADLPNAFRQTEPADLPNAFCQTEPADLPDATSQTEPADLPDASCQTEPADLPDASCQTESTDLPAASCQTELSDYQVTPLRSPVCELDSLALKNEVLSPRQLGIVKVNCETQTSEMTENDSRGSVTDTQARSIPCNNCADLEAKNQKIKLLALKARKEKAELSNQLKELKLEFAVSSKRVTNGDQLLSNYHLLQVDYDRIQDNLESAQIEMKLANEREQTLKSQIDQVVQKRTDLETEGQAVCLQLAQAESKIDEMKTELLRLESGEADMERQLDDLRKELADQYKESTGLADKLSLHNQIQLEKEAKLQAKIAQLEEHVAQANSELDEYNSEQRSRKLVDLEIADYEKTIESLEARVSNLNEEMDELSKSLDHERQRNANLTAQLSAADKAREAAEERSARFRQSVATLREEVETVGGEQRSERRRADQLHAEVESLRLRLEHAKVELSGVLCSNSESSSLLKQTQLSQSRIIQTLEATNKTLQTEFEGARAETQALQGEFDQYKIRVHSVLKQQTSRANIEAQLIKVKEDNESLQLQMSSLKSKLITVSDQLMLAQSESKVLQDELDKEGVRQQKLLEEFLEKEQKLMLRIDALKVEVREVESRHLSRATLLHEEHQKVLTQTVQKAQVEETENRAVIVKLNKQLEQHSTEKEHLYLRIEQLQNEMATMMDDRPELTMKVSGLSSPEQPVGLLRESGEGMENPSPAVAGQPPHVRAGGAQRAAEHQPNEATGVKEMGPNPTSPSGLRHLLQSSSVPEIPEDLRSQTSETSQSDESITSLRSQLVQTTKAVTHIQQLLSDSEATCLRYSDQIKVLKSEVRRLESNAQRENSISNMEYLKNVVYRFIVLDAGSDEKQQLLPVLHTMLKFTESELVELRLRAVSSVSGQPPSGWSGYLPRWTGFSS